MIDYSVFSQSTAARGSIISGPVSRSATAFNFCIQGQIRLRRHLVIGSQGRSPFSRKIHAEIHCLAMELTRPHRRHRGSSSQTCEAKAIGDAVNAFRWSIATALVLEGLPLAKITVAAQGRRGRGFATVSL
jgi:hypothetical protein